MQYVALILSITLYLTTPNDSYSLPICVFALGLFIVLAIFGMLKLRRVEFFGFNLLFTLSFFACCYIFPIFVYPIAPMYSLFEFGYDPNVISKCTALASVAYSCYVCGLLKNIKGVVKYRAENQNEILQIVDSYVDSKIIYRIALLIFVLFLLSGGIITWINNILKVSWEVEAL